MKDLEELPEEILNQIEFIPVDTIEEVLWYTLEIRFGVLEHASRKKEKAKA